MRTIGSIRLNALAAVFAAVTLAPAAELPKAVCLVPNFHPACCGWLTDWSTERNYCANTYLDHLDRVRDDPNYAFALSEVPNLIAILNFHPERVEELKQRLQEGRVELVNAFFLEPTINLSGGEALVKSGVEGLRWQTRVLGARPRFSWMIDITGLHEQAAQITAGLGLEALVYCRHNPTGSTSHWLESPDGTRVLALCPGHYSEWGDVFRSEKPLGDESLQALVKDLQFRADPRPLTPDQIRTLAAEPWAGHPQRTPPGLPVLVLGGSGDYAPAPLCRSYPTEFLRQFKTVAPETDLRFSTPGRYLDAVLPKIRSAAVTLPTMRGGSRFSFNAFWIQNPRVKCWYRRSEHSLQAAEALATIASLKSGYAYPVEALHHAWLQLLLNMDRNTLWGAAGGMVFEHDKSWDVRDRFQSVGSITGRTLQTAMTALERAGAGAALFNPLNWPRHDPVVSALPAGRTFSGAVVQPLGDGTTALCRFELPPLGTRGVELRNQVAKPAEAKTLPERIETRYYVARIDPTSGALVSLKLKPSGREMLGGPANVIVAERPKRQDGDPGDHIVDRPERETVARSSQFQPRITVTSGPLATLVEVRASFLGGAASRRVMRFYADHPRIDFETELQDIPDRTVVVAEFPLAEDIATVRRGIPYGFAQAAWSKPDPALHGWAQGITPAVRWSHYAFAGGGGVALLDQGLTGRELTGRTPIIFLLNATDKYYGYPNRWLSGRGRHQLAYALVAHEEDWAKARIPQMAWEFNCPPVVVPGRAEAGAESFVQTSDNVIVEALRREGAEIELRLAECLGQPGMASVRVQLPHRSAALTDLLGGRPQPLSGGPTYRFPVRPQQIVTLRLKTDTAVPAIEPLTDWNPLVPESKRAALNRRLEKKGHPPRGDQPQDSTRAPSTAGFAKASSEDLRWWQEARFGMFVHWGPVSLKGTEIGWSRGDQVPTEVYDQLYREFNPTRFNADEWASVAKSAGMRYLVLTTKHHDGFCLWDTKLTDYQIMNTPFRRDVVRELADACRRAGLVFCTYHSICDWHHPDYPLGSPGGKSTKTTPDLDRYTAYLKGQLAELIQNYGPLGILWFDGEWESPWTRDRGVDLNNYVRSLQPDILINNRVGKGREGMAGTTLDPALEPGDYDTPEQQIGQFNNTRPWETCMTICEQWAWKPEDKMKSLRQCLRTLVQCAGGDGNLLFNVGPMPSGEIEPRQVARLREMGQWLARYGQSVYGTRGGPFRPGTWGASTWRDNRIYLHLFDTNRPTLTLPPIAHRVVRASLLTGGRPRVTQDADGIRVAVPPKRLQDIDTIVALDLDGPAADIPPVALEPKQPAKK